MQKTFRFFLPWKHRSELDSVNARSQEGIHLVKSSRLFRGEECDPSRRFHYRLDYRQKGGYTELLHKKQGWEQVCRQGGYLWFRKEILEGRPESEYTLHGGERHALEEHLRDVVKRLDLLRNILIALAFVLILIPADLTGNWTPRVACVPLFLAILPVKAAGEIRKLPGFSEK